MDVRSRDRVARCSSGEERNEVREAKGKLQDIPRVIHGEAADVTMKGRPAKREGGESIIPSFPVKFSRGDERREKRRRGNRFVPRKLSLTRICFGHTHRVREDCRPRAYRDTLVSNFDARARRNHGLTRGEERNIHARDYSCVSSQITRRIVGRIADDSFLCHTRS